MPATSTTADQPVIFAWLGVSVKDGQVRKMSLLSIKPAVLGLLAGASAAVTGKSSWQTAALITFADGTVYTHETASGGRAATAQAAEFNILAGYTEKP